MAAIWVHSTRSAFAPHQCIGSPKEAIDDIEAETKFPTLPSAQ